MRFVKYGAILAALGACTVTLEEGIGDMTTDRFIDSGDLGLLSAGIWVDPNGCDHWIIDDGLEGYLSQRLDRNGKPVCSGIAPPNTAVGDFRRGEGIPDFI